jgi:hypothetical protein
MAEHASSTLDFDLDDVCQRKPVSYGQPVQIGQVAVHRGDLWLAIRTEFRLFHGTSLGGSPTG